MLEKIKEELVIAQKELDYNKVSWIDKHLVIDLNQKAVVLLSALVRCEDKELEAATDAAQEFLGIIKPIIKAINKNEEVA